MELDLSSLRKAVGSLGRAIKVAEKIIEGGSDTDEEEVIRAGVIQNFEFTYELCWKFMQRWIEINSAGQAVDGFTIKELFRVAAERQLIPDVEVWFGYHRARNKTSHIYNETVAKDVYETVRHFWDDATALLKTLEDRND